MSRTPLYSTLVEALTHWQDESWLGENSLLASPYLLGSSLQADEIMTTSSARGRVLQQLMQECVDALDPFDQEILQRTYFSNLKKTNEVIASELGISRAHYFRVREKAIIALEKVVVERLQPALRLEQPVKVAKLVGREANVDNCLNALRQNQSIALTGTGGVGKTTLGSYIAHQFAPDTTFWFTFYPGFNDQMDSLLFNLAYFLHSQGVSTLWSQILSQHKERKPLDLAIIQGLIRHDLEQLQPQSPLLCFDEVDLLKIGEEEAHGQIRSLIEGLHGHAPVLLMGQQNQIEVDFSFKLKHLPKSNLQEWFKQLKIKYTNDQLYHIHQYTEGNPRLLQLFITLYQMGEPFEDIITRLPNEPSVEFLLNRIWQRLDDEEQQLLMSLSVFRRPVPGQANWQQPNAQGIWVRLIDQQLVRDDGGGLSLIPTYRAVLYRLLSIEERELLHLQAALIRAKLTDYTAAAHHYIGANQADKAVLQWHQYKQEEINRGQAEIALEMFNNVSNAYLSETAQEALKCIRSQLALISGKLKEAKQSLGNHNNTVWKTPLLELEALKLKGDMASLQNEFEVAMQIYRDGLEKGTLLWEQQFPILHREISWVYGRLGKMDLAWHEAQIAYYEVEDLRGYIQRKKGNFSEAEQHWQSALKLAEQLQHVEGIAKTSDNLASFYSFLGKTEDAIAMNRKSLNAYKQIGRVISIAGSRANLAFIHVNQQDFTKAIKIANEALRSFQILNIPSGISVTSQMLAEAHLALSELNEAEYHAGQVIETEDEEGIPDAMRVLGEIELKRGNYPQAEKHIRESIRLAQENEDPFLGAHGWRALGQVYRAMSNTTQADQSFGKAIELFEEMGLDNEAQKTHEVAGDGYSNSKYGDMKKVKEDVE